MLGSFNLIVIQDFYVVVVKALAAFGRFMRLVRPHKTFLDTFNDPIEETKYGLE